MSFISFTGTTIGPSHEATGRPCEDSFAIDWTADKKWACAVVSDGCGSAPNAKEGAEFISNYLLREFLNIAPNIDSRGPGNWVIDHTVIMLANMREAMRRAFNAPLSNYSATIVATIISEAGGFILHLGDGVASALVIDEEDKKRSLKLVVQSDPENGEYANQTFYVTEPSWAHHVRITPVRDVDCIILCSDGAQELFYEGDRVHGPAIVPLLKKLAPAPENSGEVLKEVISTPEAAKLSSDDKTIVVLARPDFLSGLNSVTSLEISKQTSKPDLQCTEFSTPRIPVAYPSTYSDQNIVSHAVRVIPSYLSLFTARQARKIAIYGATLLAALIVLAGVTFLAFWLVDNLVKPDKTDFEVPPHLNYERTKDKPDDRETGANPTQSTQIPTIDLTTKTDSRICNWALAHETKRWNYTTSLFRKSVEEAQRRGLTISDCRQVLGLSLGFDETTPPTDNISPSSEIAAPTSTPKINISPSTPPPKTDDGY